ncbi:transposase [Streptomyces lavenduligriseus]|uniref:Transposase n=1 Tax=Streptomyces lavenduligriseus TaxID=67315 RepID=A0ABT0P5V4_9ACTN|nr:transposase [Streptomyces lavenduligriseus]MCL3998931.1 transposase [Streptomyces lavenduligriseus]
MVLLLSAYAPDLNPVECAWAHVERSLAALAVVALERLETLVRNRLKHLRYRPDTLDGFVTGSGPALESSPCPAEVG